MRQRLVHLLIVAMLIAMSVQEMKIVEGPREEVEDIVESIGEDGMIKIKERVLNSSMGVGKSFLRVTGDAFIELTMNSTEPEGFFVFFGTDWCGHCKKFKPTFEEMSDKLPIRPEGSAKPKFIYYQVEDSNKNPAKLFRVSGYPTLVYVRNNLLYEYEGKREEPEIFEWLDKVKAGETGEGKPYPDRLPTFQENFVDGLNDLSKVIKLHYKHNFSMFMVIVTLFLFVVGLCCMTVYQLATEESGDYVHETVKKNK